MGAFDGERAVVIGLGVAGSAVARALAAEGASVRVSESGHDRPGSAELRGEGIEVLEGGHDPVHLDGATIIVPSPGVRPDAQILSFARARRLPVVGEMEIGARLARVPYLAVTGTNGKTTTTEMLASSLRASGLDAVACGNIGLSFVTAARAAHDALVVEVSSFQLATQESFHPKVSVLLNLAPDHLDWHGSFGAYVAAKARIFARQGVGDAHIASRDDAHAAAVSGSAPCEVRWFTTREPAAGDAGIAHGRLIAGWSGADLGRVPFDSGALRADAAACAAAAHAFGIEDQAIARATAAFVPGSHRGETVATVDDVRFVDNSKATNPHATLAAVGDAEEVILIAGGDAKGIDLTPLGSLAHRLAGVVTIGAAAAQVHAAFDGRVAVRDATSIEEATRIAFEMAPPAGTVLLAPACASWDMFQDYAERGDLFAAAARSLDQEEARA